MLITSRVNLAVIILSISLSFFNQSLWAGDGDEYPDLNFPPTQNKKPQYSRPPYNSRFSGGSEKIAPDQILNAFDRKLVVKKTDDEPSIVLSLVFSKTEWFVLGKFELNSGRNKIEISKDKFSELSALYAHRVGKLVVFKDDYDDIDFDESSKVYIGGLNLDYKCEHPILISDMNGTLDTGDLCIKKNIDHLMENLGLKVFVVSTLGSGAENALGRIGLNKEDQVLVLETERQRLANTGYRSLGKEHVILNQAQKAGLCIIGMAGDSESSDGDATKNADIPFFSVHNTKIIKIPREVRVKESYCEVNPLAEKRFISKSNSCPHGYEESSTLVSSKSYSTEVVSVVCEKWRKKKTFNSPQWKWDKFISEETFKGKYTCPNFRKMHRGRGLDEVGFDYRLKRKEYDDGSLEIYNRQGISNGRFIRALKCHLEDEIILDDEVDECPDDDLYTERSRIVIKTVYDDKEVIDSIGLKNYPSDSREAKNWCELTPFIQTRVKELRK